MLRELSIENLAVIEKAAADFGGSFNVFTGETGAGKSILIGGIGAILGERTNKEIVRAGAKKAVITALFGENSDEVNNKLSELGFEPEEDLVLSREIFADGKSIARINGRTVTASVLRELGAMLVDVHGQHENRILMSNDSQRDILDDYAGITEDLEPYRSAFHDFAAAAKKLSDIQAESQNREYKIEHLRSVIEDLSALKLEKGDGARLEEQLEKVRSNAKIRSCVWGAYNALDSDGDASAGSLLSSAVSSLEKISSIEPRAEKLAERLKAVIPEVTDIADEIYSLVDDDPEDLEEELSNRVSALKFAERKYKISADELVDLLESSKRELDELSGSDALIGQLSAKKTELGAVLKKLAEELTQKRISAAKKLSEEIRKQLEFLDMPNVRIIVEVSPAKVTIHGKDHVEFLISANAGEEPRPINKIASGGELSRIMLAVKCVLAKNDPVPTMIFDEIDQGISGRAAQKVGIKLAELAKTRQVLCITHLAQIASKADCHLLIEKETDPDGERTFTHITQLDFEGRKHELARIIDGSGTTQSSLAAAEEMLSGNSM